MRLGIDFGTTRFVAAASDRGNYPVLAFEGPDGGSREWVPSLIAVRGGERHFGWDAWMMQGEPGVTLIRSIKRVLAYAGPDTLVELGAQAVPAGRLLAEMFSAFRTQVAEKSSLGGKRDEPIEAMLGVPANANSNQRFLTVEAFREAGFEVLGLLNEPSAASIEHSHRLGADDSMKADHILVYDLGGGTFDVSLMEREGSSHAVVATESIPTLGGDDFDEVLAELALRIAGRLDERQGLTPAEEFLLAEECREKKEGLHPNTRRMIVDLDGVREGWGQVAVPVSEFYDACRPLIEETLHATEDVLVRASAEEGASLYVTGGASELPLVSRLLKERFGRKVRRSAYMRSATAIGLAIQADSQTGYRLRERFTRWFGVWREAEAGHRVVFDALFERGLQLPGTGEPPIARVRRYHPAHNIGHFRYLECSRLQDDGTPTGEITPWDEIRFPFDPALAGLQNLARCEVSHSTVAPLQTIEERYAAEAHGGVTVTITNLTAGYNRSYRLGKWASQVSAVTPHKAVRTRRKAGA